MIYEESLALSATSPKTTTAFDVLQGDVLVAVSTTADQTTIVGIANSGDDLGWTVYQELYASGRPGLMAWGARAITDTTGLTVTFTRLTGAYSIWGSILVFRGALGIGATVIRTASAGQPSVVLSTSRPNSAVVNVGSHEADTDGTLRAWRTTDAGAVTEVIYTVVAGEHTAMAGYHADAGAQGAKTLGVTGLQDGFTAYVFVGVEVVTADLVEELRYTKGR